MSGPPNRTVVAVAYDGLCAFEFGVAAELFGLVRPELGIDWYEFQVVSVDPGPLRTLGGMTMSAPCDLTLVAAAGTVVLPGWRDPDEMPPRKLIDALLRAHASGARLLSICSGVFVLAATGLLDGQAATTHWRYTDQLQAAYPRIDVQPDVLYVDNGAVLTSAGSAAGLDLGLHLIRRDHGSEVANQVARRLVVAPHRDGGQAQFIANPVSGENHLSLAPTMDWAINHLNRPLTVADLAGHASMSQRTFARRFRRDTGRSPHRWLTQQRVLRAQHLLETTSHGIDVIATEAGFGSAANLRHHFERETLTTPTRYRSTFSSG
ncbi:MAG: transcriptional regulator FtrA, partial [Actinomycetia bacterium]|nr:transcriptional regulator FtrA [Actinomycetes bacterium]